MMEALQRLQNFLFIDGRSLIEGKDECLINLLCDKVAFEIGETVNINGKVYELDEGESLFSSEIRPEGLVRIVYSNESDQVSVDLRVGAVLRHSVTFKSAKSSLGSITEDTLNSLLTTFDTREIS